MDPRAAPAPRGRAPEHWLAALRGAGGGCSAKALYAKLSVSLLGASLPVPAASERWQHVMPLLVGKYAEGNPVGFFRNFMQQVVIAHSGLFAQLTALGETAVGLGLVFGCLTLLASGIGLFLVVNYGLAVQWQGSSQQGFHYMLIATLIVIFATRAVRTLGVDGWVRARRPGWWLARLPLG